MSVLLCHDSFLKYYIHFDKISNYSKKRFINSESTPKQKFYRAQIYYFRQYNGQIIYM